MKLVLALVLLCWCINCSVRCAQSRITSSGVLRHVAQQSNILPPEEKHESEEDYDWEHALLHYERPYSHDRYDRGRRERADHDEPEDPDEEERSHHSHRHYEKPESSPFVLEKSVTVIRTEAGELRTLSQGGKSEFGRENIGLKFLTLEPQGLLLPQYTDGSCVFLVHAGKGRLSFVEDGNLREIDMEVGDIYRLEGGTLFYILNTDEDQRLKIFSILDKSDAFTDENIFHNFYVAGGKDPKTILSGFDNDVLALAFQVSSEEIKNMLSSQTEGPAIIYSRDNDTKTAPQSKSSFPQMIRPYIGIPSLFADSSPKPFNVLQKKPDFQNKYGWSTAVDEKDFDMLKKVNKGVFAVSLKAGALMAPHWNPRATEIGLVTKGEGEIQIAFPNGTAAARAQVREGTVFYIPQYFPMCQIAAQNGSFEFMGFSTSSGRNRPQFLSGTNSVLRVVDPDILAAAFNIPSVYLQHLLESQTEAVILPGQEAEAPDHL